MKLLPLLLLLALPAVAQAQFTFTSNKGAITITRYTGSSGMVTIPGTIAGLPVTSIGSRTFYTTHVTNVLIPDSVINIAHGAFFHCGSLTNVTLGSGVTSIGDWAFGFCPKLKSVCCRGNTPKLGGANVFNGSPATVYYLPRATGWGPMYGGRPTVLWNPPVLFKYSTDDDSIEITNYFGSGGDVTIPYSINFLPVTGISSNAFASGNPTSVKIPNSVTNIGEGAFNFCVLLTNIAVESGNPSYTSVDGSLFNKSMTLLLQYPAGLAAFSYNSYIIPNGVSRIGAAAFAGCFDLKSVTIPNSVTSLGDGAFFYCRSLTNVIIPNGITNIGDYTFMSSGLTSVIIPNSVTNIGKDAFANCFGLTNVKLGNNVTSIGSGAFYYSPLMEITIPASVTNIGDWAFWNCSGLTNVYFLGNAPTTDSYTFNGDDQATVYYLPNTTGWDEFFNVTGVPIALWLPQMQMDASLGLVNQFGFNINWASGQTVVVDACTNLSNPDWQPVQTNKLTTGTAYFGDPQWTNYPSRFYRLRSP